MTDDKEWEVTGELTEDCQFLRLDHFGALKRGIHYLISKKLAIKFRIVRYKRSDAQNRWLWGVAYPTIAQFRRETEGTNPTKEEIHAHTLIHVIGRKPVVREIFGVDVVVIEGKTTSKMNTKEFQEFKEKLQQFYAELGCVIPDPRQNNFLSEYLTDE